MSLGKQKNAQRLARKTFQAIDNTKKRNSDKKKSNNHYRGPWSPHTGRKNI